jgi:hypothetical protein
MREPVTTKNRVGLALAAVLGVLDIIALAFPHPRVRRVRRSAFSFWMRSVVW